MRPFSFATAGRVIVGPGRADEVPALVSALGTRVLVVTGAHADRHGRLLDGLAATGLTTTAMPALAAPTANTVATAAATPDLSTLVTAVKAAGLVDTLSGKGPFTVFAPTNAAFAKLPAGTVDKLLKPENKAQLQAVLTYHVVAGKLTAKDVVAAIKAGGGKAVLTTVQGGKLTGTLMGNTVMLTDAKGGMVHVTATDVDTTNGVVHVIDGVLLP